LASSGTIPRSSCIFYICMVIWIWFIR